MSHEFTPRIFALREDDWKLLKLLKLSILSMDWYGLILSWKHLLLGFLSRTKCEHQRQKDCMSQGAWKNIWRNTWRPKKTNTENSDNSRECNFNRFWFNIWHIFSEYDFQLKNTNMDICFIIWWTYFKERLTYYPTIFNVFHSNASMMQLKEDPSFLPRATCCIELLHRASTSRKINLLRNSVFKVSDCWLVINVSQ